MSDQSILSSIKVIVESQYDLDKFLNSFFGDLKIKVSIRSCRGGFLVVLNQKQSIRVTLDQGNVAMLFDNGNRSRNLSFPQDSQELQFYKTIMESLTGSK